MKLLQDIGAFGTTSGSRHGFGGFEGCGFGAGLSRAGLTSRCSRGSAWQSVAFVPELFFNRLFGPPASAFGRGREAPDLSSWEGGVGLGGW